MNRKYHSIPDLDRVLKSDKRTKYRSYSFGFGMRLLNFLSTLKIDKHWNYVDQYAVYCYSQRMENSHFRKEERG